jgi:ACS family hexuronate transporter-like MFS transporter
LVFTAAAINYVDRQIIALLKPVLEEQFGWSGQDYGNLTAAFQLAATIAFLGAGWFIDRIGLRWGYALAVSGWSLAAMAHAFASSLLQFAIARMALGAAESVHTPAAVKSLAICFPPRERSLALGIMNTAPNIGAILTPLLIPPMVVLFGWRMAFILTGAAGLLWAVCWLAVRRALPSADLTATEAAPARVSWRELLRDRRTWAIAICKGFADQGWWFLLFWTPDFFHRRFDLDMSHLGAPIATIYFMAALGSLLGGILPNRLLAFGWSLDRARRTALLGSALVVLALPTALLTSDYWATVAIVGLALAGHQSFVTNLFATVTEAFPARVIGSVIGISSMVGNLSGLAVLELAGWVLSENGSYMPMFLLCGSGYLLGWMTLQLLMPLERKVILTSG